MNAGFILGNKSQSSAVIKPDGLDRCVEYFFIDQVAPLISDGAFIIFPRGALGKKAS